MLVNATKNIDPRPRFHLAFPVHDLEETRAFYKEVLGCAEGRSSPGWVDFDFFGHQLSAHLAPEETSASAHNPVDGHAVPVRHFGVILAWDDWHALAARLAGKINFVIEPHVRFRDKIGEQATMFFLDPSGNALEFKAFQSDSQVFANA